MDAEQITIPLEVRSVDEEQRRAVMLVCRYGETSTRTPRPERFAPGAFTRSVTERGRQDSVHRPAYGRDRRAARPPGRPPGAWDTSAEAELLAVLRFYDTPQGWDAFWRAKDGDINAGSVGFRPVAERTVERDPRDHRGRATSRRAAVPGRGDPGL